MSKCRIPLGPFHPLLEEAESFNIKIEVKDAQRNKRFKYGKFRKDLCE